MRITYPPAAKVINRPQVQGPGDACMASDEITLLRAPEDLPRALLGTVPVAPGLYGEPLTDTTPLEDAQDPAQKRFVPRYQLAEQEMADGSRHLRVALAKAGSAWTLTVVLDALPALEVAAGAQPINAIYPVVLRYRIPLLEGGFAIRERELAEVSITPTGLVAVARFERAADQAEVYAALAAGGTSCATLLVKRAPVIAVPSPWSYAPVASHVLYEILTHALPVTIPLPIDRTLHAYVFAGVDYRAMAAGGLVRRRLGGASYFQDEVTPGRFYYLPDRYELATTGVMPRLSIQATASTGRYLLDYAAVPVIDDARLRRDGEELERNFYPEGPGDAELEPLSVDKPELWLRLPASEPGEPLRYVARDHAIVDLQAEVRDRMALDLRELRALYDALFGGSEALFTGHIRVPLGSVGDQIPFVGRIFGPKPRDVWQQVYARAVPRESVRPVRIKLAPTVFGERAIARVDIDVEPGGHVGLTAEQPSADIAVPCDVTAYMLDEPDSGSYTYRATIHHLDGRTVERPRVASAAAVLRPDLGHA